nr:MULTISPECIES: hypothetical protein [unclassified Proteiniphilum]
MDSYFYIPDNSSKNIFELYGSKGSILARKTIGQGEFGEIIASCCEAAKSKEVKDIV